MPFMEDIFERVGVKGIVFFVVVLFLVKWAFDLFLDPLRDVPGPFLARFTKLWLLRQYVKGDFQETNVELHEKFGEFRKTKSLSPCQTLSFIKGLLYASLQTTTVSIAQKLRRPFMAMEQIS